MSEPRFNRINAKLAVIMIVCVFISAFFLLSAHYVYPAAGGDSLFFTQPAVNFASGQGLRIPLFVEEWGIDQIIDTTGQRRFLHYPPLYPMLLGYLTRFPSPQGVFTVIALINAAIVALSSFIFYKAATYGKSLNWFAVFLISLSLFGIATSVDESGGRPEILARLFFTLGLASVLFFKPKWQWLILGTLLGLLGATHPVGSLMAAVLVVVFFSAKHKYKKAILYSVGSSLIALLVFVAVIFIGPYSLTDTLGAMMRMGSFLNHYIGANEALNPKIFFTNYVIDSSVPFLFFVVLMFFAAAIATYRKKKALIASPILFLLSSLAFSAIIFWLMFYIGGHQFYVAIFSPLLYGAIIYYATRKGVFMKILTVFIVLLSTLGIARDIILFPFFLERGLPLEKARAEFNEAQLKYGERTYFGVTSAFWTLSENYKQMYTYYNWPEAPKKNTNVIFWQQAYSGRRTPPVIDGCKIIKDTFNAPPKIFGLKFGNSLLDYAYAEYECNFSSVKNS